MISTFKDELDGKIIIEFVALRANVYAFLIDCYDNDDYNKNNIINKKAKGTKKCVIKRERTFKIYKDSLLNNEVVIKSQHRFRRDHHKVYTEEVNKISSNDDKRIQTFDRITTYPCGTNAFNVCENEMRYVILKKMNHRHLEVNHRYLEVNHRYLEKNHKHLEVNHRYLEVNHRYLEKNHKHLEVNHRYLEVNHRYLEANQRYLEVNHRHLDVNHRYLEVNHTLLNMIIRILHINIKAQCR